MKGQKDQFRSSIGGGGVLMESNDVLMVPYSVLDGPIVLNIHVGPIPRLRGNWTFEWRPLCVSPFEPSVIVVL